MTKHLCTHNLEDRMDHAVKSMNTAKPTIYKDDGRRLLLLATIWIASEGCFVRFVQVEFALGVCHGLDQLTVCDAGASLLACFENICIVTNIFDQLWIAALFLFNIASLATEKLGRRHCPQAEEHEKHCSESLHCLYIIFACFFKCEPTTNLSLIVITSPIWMRSNVQNQN